MKLTIITVTYNCASLIRDTLASVTEQDYPDKEYLVIDGNSSDGTLRIIKDYSARYPFIKYVSEPDEGMYFAMNKGLAMATGDVIGILNAGDYYTSKRALSLVAESMQNQPTDTLYSDLQYVSYLNKNKIVRHWESGKFNRLKFLLGWMPPHPTFFVQRHVYERYGYFDTDLQISADYELMLRFLHKHGVSTQYLPGVLVKMPTGGVSNDSFAHRLQANMEDRKAWSKNYLRPRFYTLTWKPLSKIRQFFHRKK